jgi:CheY-like chemotaxis protein
MVSNVHEMIERQVQNMARMVDDLLDVSRITQGKVRLRRSPVSLADTLRSAVEVHRAGLEARDQELSVSLPADNVWVVGDEVRLEQVFSNLIHNASKFTQRGGHVWLSAAISDGGREPAADTGGKEKGNVEIRVRDDGIGIDPDVLPHVFDLFQQADRSLDRAQGGLGIGLTLARYLVELHGGSIEARSDGLSDGSEFIVRLPVLDEVELSRRKPATKEIRRSPVRPLRILVVDDNVDSADSLTLLLRHTGHTVEVAYDGSRALELAESFEPEVAFLDIGLPGMNGYDLAQQLRSKRALKKTLLIALSGYGREDDVRRAREAGFDHHLTKPADFEDVQDLLAK